MNDLREVNIDVDFPKIVVVGTQSSGKSSLLNAIINKNILPTGKNMVTRTPLDIRMIRSDEEKIEINNITFQYHEIERISEEIEMTTTNLLGNNKSVGDKPIIVNVYNKHIDNLSLIDLPGLTMVACRDKGQPENIKQQIRELIAKYISQENTIILTVMAGRQDLETDIGLDMIKEYDNAGGRTLGVITKVDLMNDGCDMTDYLEDNISKDLQLNYGYHLIMNKNGVMKNEEMEYFKSHPKYSNEKYKSQIGIKELTIKIKKILVDKIHKEMPNIKRKLITLESKNNKKLEIYGISPPININERKVFIQSQINDINNLIYGALNERGFVINTGSQLKNEFIRYRKEIIDNETHRNKGLLLEGIQRAITNYDGNHMSYSISPIEILEYCIKVDKLIYQYFPFGKKCVENVRDILYILIDEILKKINRFPKFHDFMKTLLYKNIETLANNTINKIEEIINMEEGYIWADDKDFIDELKNNKNKEGVEKIISMYMISFVKTYQNIVPKCIMYNMITQLTTINKNSFSKMMDEKYGGFGGQGGLDGQGGFNITIDTLLDEDEEIEKKRKESVVIKETLHKLLKNIS